MLLRFFIFCVCLAVSQSADLNEKVKYMRQQFEVIKRTCATIHGLTMDQMRDVETHFDEPRHKKDKCVLECFFTESGVMKDGRYSREGAENLNEFIYEDDEETLAVGREISKTCEKVAEAAKPKNGCEAAFEIHKCLKKESKQKLFKQDGIDY